MNQTMLIEYEKYDTKKLDNSLNELFNILRPFQISKNLFNINEKQLSKIISDFLENSMSNGLINIYPHKNF